MLITSIESFYNINISKHYGICSNYNLTCQLKHLNLFMLMPDLVPKGLKPVCSVHISVTAVLRFLTSPELGNRWCVFPSRGKNHLWVSGDLAWRYPKWQQESLEAVATLFSCTQDGFVCTLAICSHGCCWANVTALEKAGGRASSQPTGRSTWF